MEEALGASTGLCCSSFSDYLVGPGWAVASGLGRKVPRVTSGRLHGGGRVTAQELIVGCSCVSLLCILQASNRVSHASGCPKHCRKLGWIWAESGLSGLSCLCQCLVFHTELSLLGGRGGSLADGTRALQCVLSTSASNQLCTSQRGLGRTHWCLREGGSTPGTFRITVLLSWGRRVVTNPGKLALG